MQVCKDGIAKTSAKIEWGLSDYQPWGLLHLRSIKHVVYLVLLHNIRETTRCSCLPSGSAMYLAYSWLGLAFKVEHWKEEMERLRTDVLLQLVLCGLCAATVYWQSFRKTNCGDVPRIAVEYSLLGCVCRQAS